MQTAPVPLQKLTRLLTYAVTTMAIGMYAVIYVRVTLGRDNLFGLANKFDPRFEASFHAWMGSSLLLGCAVLLAVIAYSPKLPDPRFRVHWGILGIGFVFLSADESTALHELLIGVSQKVFGADSPTHLWALFGLAGVIAVGVAYLPFLRHLPPWFRNRAVLSAVVYLGGAIGMELLGGLYSVTSGNSGGPYYLALASTEELFELAGAAMFLVALYRFAFYGSSLALHTDQHRDATTIAA